MNIIKKLIVLLSPIQFGCHSPSILTAKYEANCYRQEMVFKTSIDDILKRPEFYSGKLVDFEGVYQKGSEKSTISSGSNDKPMVSIWVRFDTPCNLVDSASGKTLFVSVNTYTLNAKHVRVRARFSLDADKVQEGFVGMLNDVHKLSVYEN